MPHHGLDYGHRRLTPLLRLGRYQILGKLVEPGRLLCPTLDMPMQEIDEYRRDRKLAVGQFDFYAHLSPWRRSRDYVYVASCL